MEVRNGSTAVFMRKYVFLGVRSYVCDCSAVVWRLENYEELFCSAVKLVDTREQ